MRGDLCPLQYRGQDRLMRNTKDWYLFADRMSTEQKRLYMYIERKFYTPDDALITGIKAILAEGRTISTILQNDGIYNRNGKPFTDSAILRILRNPLNKGTAVMNRKHFDFETKTTIKMPEEEQFIYENKVPRAVSDGLWELANREIDKRAVRVNGKNGEKRGKCQGKSHLSGKRHREMW